MSTPKVMQYPKKFNFIVNISKLIKLKTQKQNFLNFSIFYIR